MKYDELERRYLKSAIEARGEDGSGSVIVGHASIFDTPYELWGFTEQVARGAFKKTIKEGDVRALWNHDPNIVLGRNKSGTLRLSEDDLGLAYEIDLPDTQAANDLYKLIERGDVNQSSFAFEVIRDEWEYPDDSRELPMRTIKEARLWDVSPVTYPASESTDVDVARALRSLTRALGIEEQPESVAEALTIARNKDVEATTETPAVTPPEGAPGATSQPEPKRIDHYFGI